MNLPKFSLRKFRKGKKTPATIQNTLSVCAGDHVLLFFPPRSDPDCAVLCLLAADDTDDVALQIHFTLLQAFFHENDFTILRVWGLRRLQHLLGAATDGNQNQNEQQDFHCILVTVSCTDANDTVKYTQRKNGFENVIEPCAHLCLCRTPRLSTAGCRRWRATTGRNDFSTSGCLKSSCTTLRRKTRTFRVQTARTRSRTCRGDALQLTLAECFDRAEDSVAVGRKILQPFFAPVLEMFYPSQIGIYFWILDFLLLLRCQHFKVS